MNFPSMRRLFPLLILTLPWGCAHRGSPPPLAHIDGQAVSEAEFSLYLQGLPQDRREAVSQDPEERRQVFEAFQHRWLYALAAQESGHPALDSLRRRLHLLDQMVITQFYQLIFIGENLGIPRREIEAFYSRNPEKFRDSAGHLPPVHDILARIADTMALSKADLDSFHRANEANYPLPQPDLRRKLAENYLFETKQRRSENPAAGLKAKYGARMIPVSGLPTDAEIAGYYAQNKEAYAKPRSLRPLPYRILHPEGLGGEGGRHEGLGSIQSPGHADFGEHLDQAPGRAAGAGEAGFLPSLRHRPDALPVPGP